MPSKVHPPAAPPRERAGVLLEQLPWTRAEAVLAAAPVVVLPLGALLKQHGPHLPLDTDWRTAEWFRHRVAAALPVPVLPTLGFHYYAAFTDYPGSVSLEAGTSRDLVTQICRNLSRFGPKRFYVLNTGVSTKGPLADAAADLATGGMLLRFTDIAIAGRDAVRRAETQPHGGHADEIETSMLLVIAPDSVDMPLACQDGAPGRGRFCRSKDANGIYSPSGVNGDARLATREKGEAVLEAMLGDILAEIESLRDTPLPAVLDTPG